MTEDNAAFLAFFEHHPDPMWIWELGSMRFLAVNQATCRHYGYSRDEFLSMTLLDIREASQVPALLKKLSAAEPGLVQSGVWVHRCRDGRLCHMDIRAQPLNFQGRPAKLVCGRDVSRQLNLEAERQRLLEQAQAQEARTQQAMASLQEATSLLQIAGRTASLGGWRINLNPQQITWSEGVAAIHGEAEGFVPDLETAINYYVPEHRPLIKAAVEACIGEGRSFDERLRLRPREGQEKWVRAMGQAVRNEQGEVVAVQGALQDISELVAAQEMGRALAQRLEETLESMSDAFYILDREWRFVFLNSEFTRILGRGREELLGNRVWDCFPEAVHNFKPLYEAAVARQETRAFEEYFAPLDLWFSVRAYPNAEGLAVYFQDITNRRRMESSARLVEERFQLIARATNDVIWDWDLLENTVWWNESYSQQFGYAREDSLLGPDSWSEGIHPDDRQRVLDSIHGAIDGRGVHWQEEYRFRKADGRYLVVIDRGYVIRDEQGRPLRMLGSMVDVTEQREMDERLRQSQKMEAIGQLTGGVAHDFNNLLTILLGNAEYLSEQLVNQPQLKMMADMSLTAAERGAELTSRLLAFARKQALEPKPVDINRLVTGLDGMLRRILSESIEIEVVRGGGLWMAEVDPGQLEVALINLAINARDAMPEGGRLTIETANTVLDEDYAAQFQGEVAVGRYVMVSVSDTGTGMSDQVLSRAFEPFFTTKGQGKGSGLGLSMVYGFVKQSGGHARIYSELGEGTTIRLYFPRVLKQAEDQALPKASVAEPGGGESILVVEDDDQVRDYVCAQLQSLGYRVTAAASGQQALDILQQSQQPFDLLFTDVVMPGGISGRQLAEQARDIWPGLRVLFTSGYTENAIVHHGRLDAGVDLLSKPYRQQQLAEKVRKVLDRQA